MKNKMILIIALLATILNLNYQSLAGTAEKEKDIKKLLVLMGNANMPEQLGDMMTSLLVDKIKKEDPSLSKEAQYAIAGAISAVVQEESGNLIDLIVPIYDTRFTHSDVKEIIRFYETPAGQKLSSNLQGLTVDALKIGQEWGKNLQPKMMKKVEAALKTLVK